MDNTNTIINTETKTQKDDLSANNLRDPNIILPQSRRNMKPASISGPIDIQKKTLEFRDFFQSTLVYHIAL